MELHVPRTKGALATLVAMTLMVVALQSPPLAAAQAPPAASQLLTLEPATSREQLQTDATAFLSRLLSQPANQEVRIADATPALIDAQTLELVIAVSDTERVTFQQRSFEVAEPIVQDMHGTTIQKIMQVWYGDVASDRKQRFSGPEEVDIDPFNNAMIVRDGEKLVGTIRIAGQAYRLDALENGKHAVIKVDESKLPPEAEPLSVPAEEAQESKTTAGQPERDHSVIDVLIVATRQSELARPNFSADVQLMVSHANKVNENSGVMITFVNPAVVSADYDEGDKTHSEMLNELRHKITPFSKVVDLVREMYSSDLVSMIVENKTFCGLAYVNANRATAYSAVTCTGSFAHEVGHNIGGNHNWEPGQPVTQPPYNNGYRHPGSPGFRTQMSYSCTSGGTCPKVDFWSTPLKRYQGLPLGTAEHHDNARRFNERREYVEDFYPSLR